MSATAESVAPTIARTHNGLITTLRPIASLNEESVLEDLHKAIEQTSFRD